MIIFFNFYNVFVREGFLFLVKLRLIEGIKYVYGFIIKEKCNRDDRFY